ncbi:hypothetical protein KP509_24G074300 [Ceratopteris richardii]|uniref:Uncharacterized protein n=1 Tax=Ceratopteris richardii TaxID=49495 RepID=A0A8T2RXT6_CERRI|nr:hypothetical protein KP509_24G074300 [Ceratopteris richardii]
MTIKMSHFSMYSHMKNLKVFLKMHNTRLETIMSQWLLSQMMLDSKKVAKGHMQPPIHAENGAGNDVQQPINNEEVDAPLDVNPLPENVDHWVRTSTRLRRSMNRYEPLCTLHYVIR